MTSEEQEEIEKVKDAIRVDKEKRIVTIYDEKPLFRDQLQTLIDLINRQQKEIEELKHNRDEYKEEYIKLLNARYYNYISKDKIREKIKELESLSKNITMQPSIYNYEIDLLEELLKENKKYENND